VLLFEGETWDVLDLLVLMLLLVESALVLVLVLVVNMVVVGSRREFESVLGVGIMWLQNLVNT
jgi:hypothetical protein